MRMKVSDTLSVLPILLLCQFNRLVNGKGRLSRLETTLQLSCGICYLPCLLLDVMIWMWNVRYGNIKVRPGHLVTVALTHSSGLVAQTQPKCCCSKNGNAAVKPLKLQNEWSLLRCLWVPQLQSEYLDWHRCHVIWVVRQFREYSTV